MKVWILQGVYQGELFGSVHLTEKGAALAAIGDVLGAARRLASGRAD